MNRSSYIGICISFVLLKLCGHVLFVLKRDIIMFVFGILSLKVCFFCVIKMFLILKLGLHAEFKLKIVIV